MIFITITIMYEARPEVDGTSNGGRVVTSSPVNVLLPDLLSRYNYIGRRALFFDWWIALSQSDLCSRVDARNELTLDACNQGICIRFAFRTCPPTEAVSLKNLPRVDAKLGNDRPFDCRWNFKLLICNRSRTI